jgi:Protein of unknown function (DUF3551)
MRNLTLALLTLTGLLVISQEKAHATEYPYCNNHVIGWGGMLEDCMYTTMDQCRAAASGLNGWCSTNWRIQYKIDHAEPAKKVRSRRQS